MDFVQADNARRRQVAATNSVFQRGSVIESDRSIRRCEDCGAIVYATDDCDHGRSQRRGLAGWAWS